MARIPELTPNHDDDDEDSSSDGSSKSKKRAVPSIPLRGAVAAALEAGPKDESQDDKKPDAARKLGSLWERMGAEAATETADSSSDDHDQDKPSSQTETSESAPEVLDADDEALAHLDATEERAVAASIVADEIDTLTARQAAASEGAPEAEADAAVARFLQQADANLHAENVMPVADALDQAQDETLRSLGFEPEDSQGPETMPPGVADIDYEEPDDSSYYGAGRNVPPGGGRGGWTPFARWGGAGGMAPGGSPGQNIANRMPNAAEHEDDGAEARAALGGFLVGGIIGYLIGRRRGRIRTERRLLPIQRRLESEVRILQTSVLAREEQIRRLVLSREEPANQEQPAQRPAIAPAAETTPKPKVAERLSARPPERVVKSADTMPLEQVLIAAEKVITGTTTLREIYESNLVSERGLRRIMNEHLRGGNVQRVLTEELLVKELGHELDPILRDRPLNSPGQPATTTAASMQTVPPQDDTVEIAGQNIVGTTASMAPHLALHSNRRSLQPILIANIVALLVLGMLLLVLLVIWVIR